MNVRKELAASGCIYDGHFVGVSGKHLSGYCNIDLVMPHAMLVGRLTKLLVEPFASEGVETVVVPAVGAIPLAHWGAYHLSEITGKEVLGVWGDKKKPKGFEFERGGFLEAVRGKRTLLLEDMVNQMFSIKELLKIVNEAGGIPIGVGAIAANRGVSAEAIGVPKLIKLCSIEYDAWVPEDCAKVGLCSRHIPIIEDVGHGDEFKEAHPEYEGGFARLLS